MTTPWIAAFVVLWAIVIVLALLVLGTLRRLLPVMERSQEVISSAARRLAIGGLSPGTSVPSFTAEEVSGAPFGDVDLRGSTSVVLFLAPGCKACEQLASDLEQDRVPDLGGRLVAVSDDRLEAERLARSSEVTVLVDEEHELARIFESPVTPHAFVVDERGIVNANGTPNDWEGLRLLLSTTEGGDRQPNVPAAAVRS